MNSDDFFDIASDHFEDALPFVIYRKPKTNTVKGLFQQDTVVYTSKNLTESGFVFAPFNSEAPTILTPLKESQLFETEFVREETLASRKTKEILPATEAEGNHITLVVKAIQTIASTDLKKVVVSRKETVPLSQGNPIQLFRRLLEVYTTAFVYCWYHPKIGLWLGATPKPY
nr:chorismate-binding protein [Lacinutrix neustonica]